MSFWGEGKLLLILSKASMNVSNWSSVNGFLVTGSTNPCTPGLSAICFLKSAFTASITALPYASTSLS